MEDIDDGAADRVKETAAGSTETDGGVGLAMVAGSEAGAGEAAINGSVEE
jgi:hypothetical protein